MGGGVLGTASFATIASFQCQIFLAISRYPSLPVCEVRGSRKTITRSSINTMTHSQWTLYRIGQQTSLVRCPSGSLNSDLCLIVVLKFSHPPGLGLAMYRSCSLDKVSHSLVLHIATSPRRCGERPSLFVLPCRVHCSS